MLRFLLGAMMASSLNITRAADVVSLDDARADRLMRPFVGVFATAGNRHYLSVLLIDGRFQILRATDRGDVIRALDLPSDVLTVPLVQRGHDALLGRHAVERSTRVDEDGVMITDARAGWFKRLVEDIRLRPTEEGVDFERERVLEHRDWLRPTEWWENPNDRHTWGLHAREYLQFRRLSSRPLDVDELERFVEGRRPRPRANPTARILAFPPRPGCTSNLESF